METKIRRYSFLCQLMCRLPMTVGSEIQEVPNSARIPRGWQSPSHLSHHLLFLALELDILIWNTGILNSVLI